MRATTIQRRMNTEQTIKHAETHNTPAPIFPEDFETSKPVIPKTDLSKIPKHFVYEDTLTIYDLGKIPLMKNPWSLYWAQQEIKHALLFESEPITTLVALYRKA